MTRDATTAFARALVDEWARAGVHRGLPGARVAVGAPRARARRRRPHPAARAPRRAFGGVLRARHGQGERVARRSCCAPRGRPPPTSIPPCSRRAMPACRSSSAPPTARRSSATPAPGRPSTSSSSTAAPSAGSARPACPRTSPARRRAWRSTASRAVAESLGPPAGPVHLNLPFREPLVPPARRSSTHPVVPTGVRGPRATPASARRRGDGRRARRARPGAPARADRGRMGARRRPPRPSIASPTRAGWPVLADPISDLRGARHAVVDLRGAAARSPGFAERHRPDRRAARRRAAHEQAARRMARSRGRAGPGRPRRGVARSAARGVAERLAVDPEPLLAALADALGACRRRDRPGSRAWHDAERARAGRDRRPARRLGRRRSKGASRATSSTRCPTAARWWSRRACRCATSRASPAARRACAFSPTEGSTASTGSCRPCWVSRRRHRRTDRRAGRRPVPPARQQRPARRRRARRRRDVRRGRQRRRRHLLVSPAGRAARALRARCSARPTASTSPRCPRCTVSRPTGSRRRARSFPPSSRRSRPAASAS